MVKFGIDSADNISQMQYKYNINVDICECI